MKLYQNNHHIEEPTNKQESTNNNTRSIAELDKMVGLENNSLDSESNNLLEESDLVENQKSSSRRNHAVTKILVIVGGTGILALFGWLIFGGFDMSKVQKVVKKEQTKEEKIDPLKNAVNSQDERIGELSTEIALGTQQRELSERQKRATKLAEKVEVPPAESSLDTPSTETPSPQPSSNQKSRLSQKTTTKQRASQQPTTRRYSPPPPPPKTVKIPVERSLLATPPSPPKTIVVEKPPSQTQVPQPIMRQPPPTIPKPTPPPNPQQHIARAMSFGNYGQMDYSNVDLNPTPQLSTQSSDLISKLSDDAATQQIAAGQIVEGVLNTPIFWVGDLRLGKQPQRFAIELSQPLLDSDGEIFIPEKSLLIAKLKNTSQSGMVILEINGAVTPLREMIEISPETLTVMSSTGSPLIAESQRQRGGKQNLKLSVLAGLSKVGQLLNRADSTTRYSGFGGVSSHSKNGDANILGGILEGAFGELHRQAVAVESEELEEILERPYIWVIPEGEVVRVFVNNSGW